MGGFFRFDRRKTTAIVTRRRKFFNDGGIDTEEKMRGRSAAKKRVTEREGRDEGGRRRNRVHCSVSFAFYVTLEYVKQEECVWGLFINFTK